MWFPVLEANRLRSSHNLPLPTRSLTLPFLAQTVGLLKHPTSDNHIRVADESALSISTAIILWAQLYQLYKTCVVARFNRVVAVVGSSLILCSFITAIIYIVER